MTNAGASALIAGVTDAKVYATNSVSNLDGATIYSAGNLRIARDGTRDAATGLSALAAPKLDELARSVASNAGTDNAGLNEAIGNVAANIAAGGLGFAVGGGSGAATAANTDRFNRQLHDDDKAKARKMAAASKGRYTVEQIEDQMRLSDLVDMNGKVIESGKADQINAATTKITDDGAKWEPLPGTTYITQALPKADAEIIAFIVSQQKQMLGDVPYTTRQDYNNVPIFSNTPPPMKTARCGGAQADCAAGLPPPMSDAELNARRTGLANVADWASTQLGRVSNAATAIAVNPGSPPQIKVISEGIATATNAAALGANAIEQMARPDAGKLVADGALGIGAAAVTNRFPGLAPAINEAAEAIKQTPTYKDTQEGVKKVLP
ncbi:hypothetical protein [Ralstonia pseudosolanacearum]